MRIHCPPPPPLLQGARVMSNCTQGSAALTPPLLASIPAPLLLANGCACEPRPGILASRNAKTPSRPLVLLSCWPVVVLPLAVLPALAMTWRVMKWVRQGQSSPCRCCLRCCSSHLHCCCCHHNRPTPLSSAQPLQRLSPLPTSSTPQSNGDCMGDGDGSDGYSNKGGR